MCNPLCRLNSPASANAGGALPLRLGIDVAQLSKFRARWLKILLFTRLYTKTPVDGVESGIHHRLPEILLHNRATYQQFFSAVGYPIYSHANHVLSGK